MRLVKIIIITIIVWVLDVIFWGSCIGAIYMLGRWEFTFVIYAKGVATYFVLNAFISNWAYLFNKVDNEL